MVQRCVGLVAIALLLSCNSPVKRALPLFSVGYGAGFALAVACDEKSEGGCAGHRFVTYPLLTTILLGGLMWVGIESAAKGKTTELGGGSEAEYSGVSDGEGASSSDGTIDTSPSSRPSRRKSRSDYCWSDERQECLNACTKEWSWECHENCTSGPSCFDWCNSGRRICNARCDGNCDTSPASGGVHK